MQLDPEWQSDVDDWIETTNHRLLEIERHPQYPTDVNAAVLHRLAVLEAQFAALKGTP